MSYGSELHGLDSNADRSPGEVPLPGTEALAQHEMVQMFGGDVKPKTEGTKCDGPRRPEHMPPDPEGRCGYCRAVYPEGTPTPPAGVRPGSEECPTCGAWKVLVIHSCPGFPRTDAARERYAARRGYLSWAALLATGTPDDNPDAPRPVHPRELDKWVRETQVPGLTVAVDASGCIVLHTPLGTMTVTSVEGLVNDLRVAVQMRDAMEVFDGE